MSEPSADGDHLGLIVAVLREHGGFGITRNGSENAYECDCRAPLGTAGDYTRASLLAEHYAHVAALLSAAGIGVVADAKAAERERIALAIEAQEFTTGLNWKARDAFAVAKRLARDPSCPKSPGESGSVPGTGSA